jgi:glutathione S-transferase
MGLIAALEWQGKPYRLCRVGDMPPAFGRLNPRFETPVLLTDKGRPLTESMAIAAWLEARDGERRISFDPLSSQADSMHQLMAFLNTGFTSAFYPLWAASHLEPPDPPMESALREWGVTRVVERHDRLEEMIPETRFLVADHPTLADGLLVGVARWLDYHRVANRNRWPKLAALRSRLESDPAVLFATALEEGEMHRGNGSCIGHVELQDVVDRLDSR